MYIINDTIMQKQSVSFMENNIENGFNLFPLHHAVWSGELPLVRALLASGADPNQQDELGMTPLHYAAYEGFVGIIFALILAGADINLKDGDGTTLLQRAVENGNIFAVQALLESKADPNICDNANQAPMDFAIHYGYEEIARLLAKQMVVFSKKLVGTLPIEHAYV